MAKERIEAVLERVRKWPADKQEEAVELLLALEKSDDVYELSAEELAGIERGLADAANGRFASDEEMVALLRRSRR